MHKAVKLYLRDDDDAAIGIGTLIVFIALVLVAAIAAATIIQTVYSLKDQAEATAAGARNEVAGSIKLLSNVGDRGAGLSTEIDTLWIYITHWDGSRGINMENVRILYRTTTQLAELTLDTTGGASATAYDAIEIPASANNGWDPTGTPPSYYLDANNVLRIEIDADAIGTGTGIAPNTAVTVQFMPGSGPVVTEYFVTPPSYGGDQYIDLTNL